MLRVSVLELPARWGRPDAVLETVGAMLTAQSADLVLLPETSLTGYVSPRGDYDLSPFAETGEGPTATGLAHLARKHRTHLVAPLVLREESAIFNAMVCVGPNGDPVFTYRKRHPWFPETWATPGPASLPLVDIGGFQVTLAICFDLHFLEAESAAQLEAADLLLFPSAWVDDEGPPTRVPLLQALSRKFRLAVANANWGPGDVQVPGQGGSCILGADGNSLAQVAPGAARADCELVP